MGTAMKITGGSFGSSQGSSTVTLLGKAAAQAASSWSVRSSRVNVPGGAASGNVVVTGDGVASNKVSLGCRPAFRRSSEITWGPGHGGGRLRAGPVLGHK